MFAFHWADRTRDVSGVPLMDQSRCVPLASFLSDRTAPENWSPLCPTCPHSKYVLSPSYRDR